MDCARKVGGFLQAELSLGSLAELPVEIRYVPIVMPSEWHDRYHERSRVRRKQGIYECAPHLDYDVFVNGSEREQIEEYIRGLETSAAYLSEFGASEEHVAAFRQALASAAQQAHNP
jgi:hypothetical protein